MCFKSYLHCLYQYSQATGEGSGTPLQSSCLENPMEGGAWCAAVHGVAKSRTRLSDFTFTFTLLSLQFLLDQSQLHLYPNSQKCACPSLRLVIILILRPEWFHLFVYYRKTSTFMMVINMGGWEGCAPAPSNWWAKLTSILPMNDSFFWEDFYLVMFAILHARWGIAPGPFASDM